MIFSPKLGVTLKFLIVMISLKFACASRNNTTDFCKQNCGRQKNICCVYSAHGFGPHCKGLAQGKNCYSRQLEYSSSCWARQCKISHSRCRAVEDGTLGEITCFIEHLDVHDSQIPIVMRKLFTQCLSTTVSRFQLNFTKEFIEELYWPIGGDDETNRAAIQIIWSKARYIGCTLIKYKHPNPIPELGEYEMILLQVCHFFPDANKQRGKPVFRIGKPAGDCPDGEQPNEQFPELCGVIRSIDDDLWIARNHVREFSCGPLYYRTFFLDTKKDALYVGAMDRVYRLNLSNINQSNCEQALQRLHDLQELNVEGCKILQLEASSFETLANLKKIVLKTRNSDWSPLKKIVLKTRNSDWSPGKSLEINSLSFVGLRELQSLNLSDNNIRALPEGVFCTLQSLKTLNLTYNRLRSVERLGFGDGHMSICSSIDLQILDLSHNEIRALPEISGFSRLRRLQDLDLGYNNISFVSGETLTGLVNLRTLNLANNKIEILPRGIFAGSRELREIHLQNNSLSSLAKGIFHRLEQLIVLDLSGNQLSSGHIDAGTFTGLIRLIVLNLSHNSITRIDGRTFKDLFFLQILDLRNNSIGFIEDNAFLPLYNLHTLNLAENRLNTIGPLLFNGLFVLSKLTLNNNLIVNIDTKAFQNCSDLKELDLSSNALQDVPDAVQELTFLKTLDLGENQISDFRNGSFKNLDQLTGLRMIDNNIGNLTKGMFWDLPALQVLNLAKNKIQSIERGTFDRNTQVEAIRLDENFLSDINGVFATLASLLWLNLSENHLVWFDYAFIPSNLKWLDIHNNFIEHLGNYYKIQDEIRVKTLDASHNRISEVSPMAIPNSVELLFINNNFIRTVHPNTFLDKVNLARVDMYANDLVNLELSSFRLSPIPFNKSLPEIYLGGNPLHCDCTMEWLQRINNMSYTRSYPKIMDLDNIVCRMTHSRGMTHMPLVQAKPSDFLCTYETHCFALCHCCDFDACDCEMTCPNNCSCYQDETWNTNVVDCSSQNAQDIPVKIPMDVTELYLDGNDFKELENHVFIGRKNMKVLYVNASGIETIQNRTFNGLNDLTLKELYLQSNLIAYIGNNTFSSLNSLEIIRLDGNKLVQYPIWEFTTNSHLNELSIANNPWSCRCKFLQEFTAWVGDNAPRIVDSSEITCTNPEKIKTKQQRAPHRGQFRDHLHQPREN
ncbi:Leucine rich repeat [Popillia japonica]|uniref:Leucine rich repeat n=1 Tax=Popillia japonica TaxID=7064 RepID=A0AAW1MW60_POPJA